MAGQLIVLKGSEIQVVGFIPAGLSCDCEETVSNTSLLTFYLTVTLNPDIEVHTVQRNHPLMHFCNFLAMLDVVVEIECQAPN